MIITRKQIKSSASPEDAKPWYEIAVTDGYLTINTDGDGGHAADLTEETIAVDTSQDSVVAVEQDGGLITFPQRTDDAPTLRAHLGWYDAETDTLTLLEFVES